MQSTCSSIIVKCDHTVQIILDLNPDLSGFTRTLQLYVDLKPWIVIQIDLGKNPDLSGWTYYLIFRALRNGIIHLKTCKIIQIYLEINLDLSGFYGWRMIQIHQDGPPPFICQLLQCTTSVIEKFELFKGLILN